MAYIRRLTVAIVGLLMLCPAVSAQQSSGFASMWPADLVLMYYAGTWRPKWTTEQVLPYVMHTYADGHKGWFFPGFLFFDFTTDGYAYIPAEPKKASCRQQWIDLQDRALAPGRCLNALEQSILQARAVLGAPPFRHKAVLGLPNPIPDQTNWGKVGRKNLNFNSDADRLEAIKWYIDSFLQRVKKAGFTQFDIDGFYWTSENTTKSDNLIPMVAQYVHSLGYRFYWIPYFNSPRKYDWRELGFDIAYLQPNYYFRTTTPLSRLDESCVGARDHGMGLELEVDRRHFNDFDNYKNRMHDYLDAFERYGAYDNAAIAYYDENDAFLKLSQSDRAFDHQLLDRLAALVARRHNGLPVKGTSAINNGSSPRPRPTDWRDPEYWHF